MTYAGALEVLMKVAKHVLHWMLSDAAFCGKANGRSELLREVGRVRRAGAARGRLGLQP